METLSLRTTAREQLLDVTEELQELVARKGAVKYVTGGTIVMEPADLIEGEAIVAGPGPV